VRDAALLRRCSRWRSAAKVQKGYGFIFGIICMGVSKLISRVAPRGMEMLPKETVAIGDNAENSAPELAAIS